MTFLLIVLGISAIYLYLDFRTDPKDHAKAKIVHGILIVLLFYSYLGSISDFVNTMRNIGSFFQQQQAIGIIPGGISAVISFLSSILSVIVLWNVGKMMRRHNGARKLVIKLLPLLGLFGVFSFYGGFVLDGDMMGFSDWGIILLGFIIMMGIFLGIMFIYCAPFMVRFFERVSPNAPLTDLIDRIGEDEARE